MLNNHADNNLDNRITSLMKGGKMIVEVGCGAGYVLDIVSPLYETAIGIDVSEYRINQRHSSPRGWQFIRSDLNKPFPVEKNCADVVFSNQVIEHISDPVYFVRQIYEVLRPGGICIVTTPNVRYVRHLWKLVVLGKGPRTSGGDNLDGAWDNGHIHYFTHKDLLQIFWEAGFSNVMSQALIDLKRGTPFRKILNQFASRYLVREFFSGNILLIATK